jgi:branched-chain amino acid transport system substrate-binding protein
VLDWWDRHGDLLLRHMRACGQMWDQRLERRATGISTSEDHAPRIRS